MIKQLDEVTYSIDLDATKCPGCGDIGVVLGDPFDVDTFFVLPLQCVHCGYGYSIHVLISEVKQIFEEQQ